MIRYTVMKGDSLWKISGAHGLSLDALLAANPQICDPNLILPGTVINIPELWTPRDPSAPAGCEEEYTEIPDCGDTGELPCIYNASAGETLEGIACRFMIPLTQLIYCNLRWAKRESLPEGARIVIPESAPKEDCLPPVYYRKRHGCR